MEFLSNQCASSSIGPGNNFLSTFVTTIVALHCNVTSHRMWPKDYGRKALKDGFDEYDFIIVGAGTAGSLLASRLAENCNDRILLIEAGPNPPLESEIPGLHWSLLHSPVDWRYPINIDGLCGDGPKDDALCTWSKGKVLGGSQSIDEMIYLRGNSRDYDNWEKQGNPFWGWNDVLPYFMKTEKFRGKNTYGEHGISGALSVEAFKSPKFHQFIILDAASELGYKRVNDFTGGNYRGFGRVYGTLKNGRRMSTAKAFLKEKRDNLDVLKYSTVYKINFDSSLRAESVSLRYKDIYDMKVKAKKEIILSAGSVETPKLLMLSGIGSESHLNSLDIPVLKDLPVGNNLQDHVRVALFLKLSLKNELGLDNEFLDAFYNQWVHRRGQYSSPLLDIAGYIDTDNNGRFPDIQFLFAPITNSTWLPVFYQDHISRHIQAQLDSSDQLIVVWVTLQKPRSKGYIRLRSINYLDYPYIYPNYLDKKQDMKRLIKGIRKVQEFVNTETFKNFRGKFLRADILPCDSFEEESDDYWECYVTFMAGSGRSPVGTAKMGPKNDKKTVVTPKLKVNGVKGLRVVDSSVIPEITCGNTAATTMMIAEKAADIIKKHWRANIVDRINMVGLNIPKLS